MKEIKKTTRKYVYFLLSKLIEESSGLGSELGIKIDNEMEKRNSKTNGRNRRKMYSGFLDLPIISV